MERDGYLAETAQPRRFGDTLALRFDAQLRRQLDREAERLGVPVSRIVRECVARALPLADPSPAAARQGVLGGPIAVRFDAPLRERLEHEAERLGVPLSRVVRRCVERALPLSGDEAGGGA